MRSGRASARIQHAPFFLLRPDQVSHRARRPGTGCPPGRRGVKFLDQHPDKPKLHAWILSMATDNPGLRPAGFSCTEKPVRAEHYRRRKVRSDSFSAPARSAYVEGG